MTYWWRRILRHAGVPVGPMVAIAALLAGASAAAALAPWPLKLLVDLVLKPDADVQRRYGWLRALPGARDSDLALILWLCVAMLSLYLLSQGIRVTIAYLLSGLGSRLTYRLGAEVLSRLQELTLVFHSRQRVGDMVQRVTTDSGCVRDLVCGVMVPGARACVDLIVMFLFMWQLDRLLALIAIAFAVPLALVIRWCTAPLAERAYEQQQVEAQVLSLADQTLGALPAVQSFTREPEHDRQYRVLNQRLLVRQVAAMWAQLRFKFATSGVTALGSATIMLLGGLAVADGRLSLGGLLVFLAYLAALYAPMETLSYLSATYANSTGSARRVLEVLDTAEHITDAPGAQYLPAPSLPGVHEIRFSHVSFSYRPGQPVLRDLDLIIPQGQVVALVGPTGSGKSTMLSLVPRLLDAESGAVLIGGRDVRSVRLASLRDRIAVVPQEPLLLPMSVSENIAYARPGATLDQIQSAARAANAEEFILRMEGGYGAILGTRGATLSVGQRQRLSIARALLKDAPILLLDEPTSALDPLTERNVVDALARLSLGRTCIIIAHRLSTIRHADRVLVLDEGAIVQDGTYAQLVAQDGLFRQMHQVAHPFAAVEVRT